MKTHRVILGKGNRTLCGRGFIMKNGVWTKMFSTDEDKVTCLKCLKKPKES